MPVTPDETDDERTNAVRSLCGNAWRWDYWEFAKRTGSDPTDVATKDRWHAFQDAAGLLHKLDAATLYAVTRPSD